MSDKQFYNNVETGMRIGCGALLGLGIGLFTAFRPLRFHDMTVPMLIALPVAFALICAFLGYKYGDEFFQKFHDWS